MTQQYMQVYWTLIGLYWFDLGPGCFPVLLKENPLGVFPHQGGNKWVSEIVEETHSKSCIPFKDIDNVLSGYGIKKPEHAWGHTFKTKY